MITKVKMYVFQIKIVQNDDVIYLLIVLFVYILLLFNDDTWCV